MAAIAAQHEPSKIAKTNARSFLDDVLFFFHPRNPA
jgi:hypothetical protein